MSSELIGPQCLAKVVVDASAVFDYAFTNGLMLNTAKCKVMILGSDAYVRLIDLNFLPFIRINGMCESLVEQSCLADLAECSLCSSQVKVLEALSLEAVEV